MGHGDKLIRIRYGKEGAGKYISHLDTIRAAERAIRRMGLPLLYSEGYTPRPRLSFAAALQVGVSSSAEHMDVFLTEDFDPAVAMQRGESSFPEAMPILAAGSFDGSYSLPSKVRSAAYAIRPYGSGKRGWKEDELVPALTELMSKDSILVPARDGGQKEARDLIFAVKALAEGIEVKLACGDRNLRPQAFMEALSGISGVDYGISQDIRRIGLEVVSEAVLRDPMADCANVNYSKKFRS